VFTYRHLLAVVALLLWAVGMYFLVTGSPVLGVALILVGGLCLVIAASRGWTEFFEGVGNALFFWR